MKKFLLFVGGLAALTILIVNLGPMVLMGVGIWLLYIVFKQFLKSHSTLAKIAWVIIGLLLVSMVLSNVPALIGLGAAAVLYLIYKNWKQDNDEPEVEIIDKSDDPFTNFEWEWNHLNL
ncbi:flagellar basal body rod protein [Lentibacillus sp. N15]|uniref:lmo0954 family membrane protein n=1 Tax=Lentibacillus songyuanensis TaxID=3136161 RepID=UPI0031BA000C